MESEKHWRKNNLARIRHLGKKYSSDELRELFEVIGFSSGFCVVQEKQTGEKGSFEFDHSPRVYFNYYPDN